MKCASFLLALCVFQAGHSAKGGPTAPYTPRKETRDKFMEAFKPINDNYWIAVKAIKPNLKRTPELSALMDKCMNESNDKDPGFKGKRAHVEHTCDGFYDAADHSHFTQGADIRCGYLVGTLVPDEEKNSNAAVLCVKKCLNSGANCK